MATAYAHSKFYAGGRSSSFDTEDGGEVYLPPSELYPPSEHLGTPRKKAQDHGLGTPKKKARTRARREVREEGTRESAKRLQYSIPYVCFWLGMWELCSVRRYCRLEGFVATRQRPPEVCCVLRICVFFTREFVF